LVVLHGQVQAAGSAAADDPTGPARCSFDATNQGCVGCALAGTSTPASRQAVQCE